MATRVNDRKAFLIILSIGISVSWLQPLTFPALAGQIQNSSTIKIYSYILKEQRTLYVSIPDDYGASEKAYPVLYILDAEARSVIPRSVSTLKDLNAKGLAPEMIVVGVWNKDRNRDMIPVAVSHRPGSGRAKNFLNFITDELTPYIRQNYRASDHAILFGMSNSALFAVYALFEDPGAFDAVIASSPMIGHCPEFIQKKAEAFIAKKGLDDKFLYMVYGDKDSQRVTEYVPDLKNYLNTHRPDGFKCKCEILPREGHVPKSSLARGLRFIFSMQVSHW